MVLPGPADVPDDPGLRFCDGRISCQQIQEEIQDPGLFPDIEGIPDPTEASDLVCSTLNDWLDKPEEAQPQPPIQPPGFVSAVKDMLYSALDPQRTVVERTRNRLRLSGEIADRFGEDAQGDPLDALMWSPTFPTPMYEPLRDISHQLLLPGIEKIPQNTISALKTNRRFLEAYMCGLNHELAGELLWRGYPTDQRGSYFRQFWDVSGYVPRQEELNELLSDWLDELDDPEVDSVEDLDEHKKLQIVKHALDDRIETVWDRLLERWLADTGATSFDELPEEKQQALTLLREAGSDAVQELPNEELNHLVEEVIQQTQLEEKLKDVQKLTSWRDHALGDNQVVPSENLVLLIRGDLLKRYPNATIYAVNAVPCDGGDSELVPGLPEYLKEQNGTPITDPARIEQILSGIRRTFPAFQATLPPDLSFFGFPFSEDEARSGSEGPGKFFILEEQVTEPRFGLDSPSQDVFELENWNDLSWSHFDFGEGEDAQRYGDYLDEPSDTEPHELIPQYMWDEWQGASAARRARITCQKPVRLAVHADQMLPAVSD